MTARKKSRLADRDGAERGRRFSWRKAGEKRGNPAPKPSWSPLILLSPARLDRMFGERLAE
jgi:hypothetical protein